LASSWERNDHAYLIQWREVGGKQKSKQFQSEQEAEKFKLAVENRLRMERADPDPFGWNSPDPHGGRGFPDVRRRVRAGHGEGRSGLPQQDP
jgi:hypothetical protein